MHMMACTPSCHLEDAGLQQPIANAGGSHPAPIRSRCWGMVAGAQQAAHRQRQRRLQADVHIQPPAIERVASLVGFVGFAMHGRDRHQWRGDQHPGGRGAGGMRCRHPHPARNVGRIPGAQRLTVDGDCMMGGRASRWMRVRGSQWERRHWRVCMQTWSVPVRPFGMQGNAQPAPSPVPPHPPHLTAPTARLPVLRAWH